MINQKEFINVLISCFGESLFVSIINKETLSFKSKVREILDDLKNPIEICPECPYKSHDSKSKIKKMDFPSWIGSLKSDSNRSIREIMIIGKSVSDVVKTYVHTAFNLQYDFNSIDKIETLNHNSKRFWKIIQFLIGERYHNFIEHVYVTDLAYCNTKKPDVIHFCINQHLYQEIEYINPKLILINGFSTKNLIHWMTRPFVCIPHTSQINTKYPFNLETNKDQIPIWNELKEKINSILGT